MASRIKGASLINTLAILREALGVNLFQAAVDTCPPETQQLIRRTLVAVEWVPLELWAPFLQAIFEQTCRKDEQQYRRLLRAVCKRDFSTVYRVFMNQATPQVILSKAPSIWSAYFDTGSLSVDVNEVQGARVQVVMHMRDLETQYPLYAVTMQAYLEQLLLMAGAQRLSVQRARETFKDGKLSCDYVLNYGTT